MNTIKRRVAVPFVSAVMALGVMGCDVTNPGPVQDEFLDLPESQQPLVNGAPRMLLVVVKNLGYSAALPAREIFPGGQTGNHGHEVIQQAGYFSEFDAPQWGNAQQARFIAESSIERFTRPGFTVAPAILAQTYTWAGYVNRVMGEHFCYAVFDGGPLEPGTRYFERAEQHFTRAIEVAAGNTALRNNALAGRAQVRLWLRKWAEAEADAKLLANDFSFSLIPGRDIETRNRIYFANANNPFRGYSIWKTWFELYYEQTGDPRTPWVSNPAIPFANAQLSGYGNVPWKNQAKYKDLDSPIRLASGREMRLIEAETRLARGDWQGAMELINGVRTSLKSDKGGAPLQPWVATSLEAAWTFLKRERAIELWLEARRFGDLRRWDDAKTPGLVDWPDYESVSVIFRENQRSRCFGITEAERDNNPNITEDPSTTPLWYPIGHRP
jgi:hypothetical protein